MVNLLRRLLRPALTSRRARALRTFVLPLPFCPMKPKRFPTLSSSVVSSNTHCPATVIANLSIFKSFDLGVGVRRAG